MRCSGRCSSSGIFSSGDSPAAWYAEHRSAKQLMFWSLLLWGAFAALTGVISDVSLLYIDRFLLGVAESVVFQ